MPLTWIKTAEAEPSKTRCLKQSGDGKMSRLLAIGFILALGSVAQAMPLARLQAPDSIVNVREDCGVGFTRVNGRCVRTPARAAARRCAAGMTLVEGRCTQGGTQGQAPTTQGQAPK
jgi:hypothetical protein